jgi:maleylacetoacetate isomerase
MVGSGSRYYKKYSHAIAGASPASDRFAACPAGLSFRPMKLYNYFRSSASFRVRIALALKSLPYEYVSVHLAKGAHKQADYLAIAADGLVPLLELDDGTRLTQSLAIMEYLDEALPATPALLPADALGRARVRALSQSIACEIHPLNNLRVLKYLTRELKVDEDTKNTWYRHWVRTGLEAFERQLALLPSARYCHGDVPTMADCCLVPQIFNGQRFNTNFDGLPRTMAVFESCMALEAFQKSQPSACPDAEA